MSQSVKRVSGSDMKGIIGRFPAQDAAANCGAGACNADLGCDDEAFTMCMKDDPAGPKRNMVTPEEQQKMMGVGAVNSLQLKRNAIMASPLASKPLRSVRRP